MQLEKFNIGFQYRWLLPLLEKLFLNSCHNNIPTNWVSWNRKLGKISPMGDTSSNKDRAMVLTLTPALPKTKQKGYSVTMCCNSVFWHMCKLCVPAYNTWHASGKGKKNKWSIPKAKKFLRVGWNREVQNACQIFVMYPLRRCTLWSLWWEIQHFTAIIKTGSEIFHCRHLPKKAFPLTVGDFFSFPVEYLEQKVKGNISNGMQTEPDRSSKPSLLSLT